MEQVLSLIALLLQAIITGGGLSYILEDVPGWSDWHPRDPRLKAYAALAITLVVLALLVWAETSLVPDYFGRLPVALQTVLSVLAGYLSSQVAHQHDNRTANRLRANEP